MATRKPIQPDNTTTALANWDEELIRYAQEASDAEKLVGNFISVKSGILQVGGAPVEGNKMEVVVLDAIAENQFYETRFDANNPSTPKCYAFGNDETTMGPSEVDVPERVSELCATCPNNAWGSDPDGGKGKACKNVKRLCIISYNGLTPEKVAEAEKFFLKVSVTNVKSWAAYVKTLNATLRRPPFAVVTEISVVPDPKSQFRLIFKPIAPLPAEFQGVIMAKHEEAKLEIAFPYPKYVAPAEGAPAKAARPVKRKF